MLRVHLKTSQPEETHTHTHTHTHTLSHTLVSCTMSSEAAGGSPLQVYAVRFGPGQELLGSLRDFVERQGLQAPFVITCVGSVTTATLRLANATATNTNEVVHLSGRYELVSLVGTLNPEAHLHVSLADGEGRLVGGHALGDLRVFTTAEVVLGEAPGLRFSRETDRRTGFPELVVRRRAEEDAAPPGGRAAAEQGGATE